ncbi:MAG: recombinase family protein [Clostridium sp.]|uniref:recombinase family protein n=1 Tax=Clostridium sp. TaxID=1506 RepID=UPI0029113E30|nr:recombinase family protein [Clostridium sp.]MDU4939852.1 recombinase family protein [Clostridium sp.]
MSRLGRKFNDLIEIIDQLVNKGIRGVILKEGIDVTTNKYKLFLAIFGGVSEMKREIIQEIVIQGVEKCKATGETKTGRWF